MNIVLTESIVRGLIERCLSRQEQLMLRVSAWDISSQLPVPVLKWRDEADDWGEAAKIIDALWCRRVELSKE